MFEGNELSEFSKDSYAKKLLSVVIPAHNEAQGIKHTLQVIKNILTSCDLDWEIILIDDGSQDDTFEKLRELVENEARFKGVRFSRNFGKEAAILAGLKMAKGDAVIIIDADLQHPPQLIPLMVEEWRKGTKVVDAVKQGRDTDGIFAKFRAKIFNMILSKLGGINVQNSSDFKLLDRLIVNTIVNEINENQRFFRGLSDWVGYSHVSIPFDVEERVEGQSKWGFFGLIGLAITAIISFTSAPLRIVTILGFIVLTFGFIVATEALVGWYQGVAISGFTTMLFTLLILGSFIMISLGIIGEYIAKIYDEIKFRPPYLIEDKISNDED